MSDLAVGGRKSGWLDVGGRMSGRPLRRTPEQSANSSSEIESSAVLVLRSNGWLFSFLGNSEFL
jgi:hypothetical protein